MKDRAYESISNEEEVCCLIGQAVIELSDANQPVNKSTLSLKLLSMADREANDDEKVMLYWLARRAIARPEASNRGALRQVNAR